MSRNPQAGEVYTFTGDTPLGADAGALLPGARVTVRETVTASTPGAHDDSETAAVVEWEAPSLVSTGDGWEQGTATRAFAIGVTDFAKLFTKEG